MSLFEKPTIKTIFKGSGWVRFVSFSPNENILCSVGDHKKVICYDLLNGIEKEFKGHTENIWACDYSPTGKFIVSGSSDTTLRLWDPESEDGNSEVITGHSDGLRSIRFTYDGKRIISGSVDQTIRIWDVERKSCISELEEGDAGWVYGIDVLRDDNTIVSAHRAKLMKIWDLRTEKSVQIVQDHSDAVRCVRFHPNGHSVVSGSYDSSIKLYDFRSFRLLNNYDDHSREVYGVCFHPKNGDYLISGSRDESIIIFNPPKEKPVHKLTDEKLSFAVSCVQFSPKTGNYFASACWDEKTILWKSNFFDYKETQSKMDLEERIGFVREEFDKYNHKVADTFVVKIGSLICIEVFSKFLLE